MDDLPGRMGGTPARPARFFADAAEFAAWLALCHATESELWMGLAKRHVADRGLTWEDAVPEALCWGWIDSQVQRLDDDFVRQRWTPRKPTSNWSRVNLALVERLIDEGRMQPPGLAAYQNRREPVPYAYEREDEPMLTQAHLDLMAADTAFWEQTTPSYRRICITWVAGAKQQATRDRRMRQLLSDHAAGRTIPTQRWGKPPSWLGRAAAAAAAVGD